MRNLSCDGSFTPQSPHGAKFADQGETDHGDQKTLDIATMRKDRYGAMYFALS